MNETLELYRELWDKLNIAGKIIIYPLFILIFPITLIVSLCIKRERKQ